MPLWFLFWGGRYGILKLSKGSAPSRPYLLLVPIFSALFSCVGVLWLFLGGVVFLGGNPRGCPFFSRRCPEWPHPSRTTLGPLKWFYCIWERGYRIFFQDIAPFQVVAALRDIKFLLHSLTHCGIILFGRGAGRIKKIKGSAPSWPYLPWGTILFYFSSLGGMDWYSLGWGVVSERFLRGSPPPGHKCPERPHKYFPPLVYLYLFFLWGYGFDY